MIIDRRVCVDGIATRVLETGVGPPVVLIHGGAPGCAADDWVDVLAPLARHGFRALTYDQPGFGLCDRPPDLSLAYRERFVLALFDAIELAQAHVVGHSQAGRLVISLAQHHPEHLRSATVLSTGSLLPTLAGSAGKHVVGPPAEEPSLAEVRTYLEGAVYDRSRITDLLVRRFHRFSCGANFMYTQARASHSSSPYEQQGLALSHSAENAHEREPWEGFGELVSPLMLMYGANDGPAVPERLDQIRRRYPEMPIHLIEECGHFAQWDQPEIVINHLVSFLRKNEDASE